MHWLYGSWSPHDVMASMWDQFKWDRNDAELVVMLGEMARKIVPSDDPDPDPRDRAIINWWADLEPRHQDRLNELAVERLAIDEET